MGWRRLLEQRRVERREASADEIQQLLKLATRAENDSRIRAVSPEGRFDNAYDAARVLATVVVRASGYRVLSGAGAHAATFAALEAVDRVLFGEEAMYFGLCRGKRNELSYVQAQAVSQQELEEILVEVSAFRRKVEQWLAGRAR
jgi:hypothetical protein